MRKVRMGIGCLLLAAAVLFGLGRPAQAAEQKAGWTQAKDGKYYYIQKDGTVYAKTGLRTIGKYTYYFLKDHSRYSGFKKIKGSIYYFRTKNGRRYEVPGWSDYQKKTYYFNKDFSLATGAVKISGKWYFFNSAGELQRNKKPFLYNGKYYRTDKNGVVSKMSSTQARASIATWKFINKYSKSSQSRRERFRRCFNRMEGYMHYRPGYIKIRELSGTDWPYKCVLKVLNNNCTGNCYGFACTIASIAKELGYEPTIIVMTCDHAVVMIDGKYYDNMGARFGTSYPAHRNYKVYKKYKM